jgi:7,8-dihydropterin-6-yl-methyl-4-(beta-D-ribofuranosyl)aminobenzene 5'-phosphate synthase
MVNVLKHARECGADTPIHVVMGGFHLAGVNEEIIPETVAALSELEPRTIAAGHCTGWRAINALANAFGDGALDPWPSANAIRSEHAASRRSAFNVDQE